MSFLAFLRRFLKRSQAPSITHTLVCGASRAGKSEAELARLVSLARRGDCAIVVLDPPGTLASKFLLHLHARGLDSRVLYDRLTDTDRVPGYAWLTPSAHPDPLQREAENDERIREFAALLLRRRGIQDTALTPLIEEGLLAALRLYLAQEKPTPLPWLADVFDTGSDIRARLLAHCSDPRLVRKFHEYAALSPTARRTETAPVERILRAVCLSPAFRARSGGATFDLDHFLDERGILILDGSSRGALSRDAAAVMMGAVILRVIEHCRSGSRSQVVLVLDEAANAGLLGLQESRALAEAGKWGLEFHILLQDLFSLPSAEIRSNVLQNCWRHEWFRQGSPEAARLAAEDIAIPLLDPLRVHHTEFRVRIAGTRYDVVRTTNRTKLVDASGRVLSRGTSWNSVLWPRRTEIREKQDRYTALADQILLMQKQLMRLGPGYRFVRADEVTTTSEYVPMLSAPVSAMHRRGNRCRRRPGGRIAEMKLREILGAMKQRGVFGPPLGSSPSRQGSSTRSGGAAKRLADRSTTKQT